MSQFVVGIDLGTSNSAMAWARKDVDNASVEVLEVQQAVEIGVTESRRLLPSFLYIPADAEFTPGSLALPWDPAPKLIAGTFAREHGAKVPDRLVSSAKSWLCHSGVDRRGPILPWGRSDDGAVRKISPLEASARYLMHLRKAFDAAHPDTPLGQQTVVLTVPASFDPGARELTAEAARAAGLNDVVLLEEPQAALYAWLDRMGDSWRKQLPVGELVLVVDIGGGTTDFSLIEVTDEEGTLGLRRVAVGDHILLGGDNMDFAVAYAAKREIEATGAELDAWQVNALVQAARTAKEDLLGDTRVEKHSLLVPNRGSKLFKKSLKAELTRSQLNTLVQDGFFPECRITDAPSGARRGGLTQLGLPYANDPGITRHLAQFLTRNARNGEPFARPSAVLFNGGVLASTALRDRLLRILNGWLAEGGAPPARVLAGAELDLAVARGAASFGLVRAGRGLRIRGGTARSYYVGIEQPMPAIPGYEPPVSALCVAPFGMEEGTEVTVPDQRFGLVVGEPARFRFFSSSLRKQDAPGTELPNWNPSELEELPPIETTLAGEGSGEVVEVGLTADITPVGTLELHTVELGGAGRRWKLEFDVREQNRAGAAP